MDYDLNEPRNTKSLTHSTAVDNHNNFDLVAGVDIRLEQRKAFNLKFQKPAFANLDELKKSGSPIMFIISTPTPTHHYIIKDILSFSEPKLILCEKPLSYKISEAKKINDLCKKKNINLIVNYVRQSDKSIHMIKNSIKNGVYSNAKSAEVRYSGGVFNTGSHFIRLLTYFFGNIIECTLIKKNTILNDGDFTADFLVNFNGFMTNFISNKKGSDALFTLEILFSNGKLSYSANDDFIWSDENGLKRLVFDNNNYQLNVLNDINNFMDNKKNNLTFGIDDLKIIKMLNNLKKI